MQVANDVLGIALLTTITYVEFPHLDPLLEGTWFIDIDTDNRCDEGLGNPDSIVNSNKTADQAYCRLR